jgi:hypothetical protein
MSQVSKMAREVAVYDILVGQIFSYTPITVKGLTYRYVAPSPLLLGRHGI